MKNAPNIAATPTIRGIAEAASAPNTKARRTKVSGIEIASEIFRSLLIFSVMAFPTTPTPPA